MDEDTRAAVPAQAASHWRDELGVADACIERLQTRVIPSRKLRLCLRHPAAAWLDLAAAALVQAGYALQASERDQKPVEPQLALFGEEP